MIFTIASLHLQMVFRTENRGKVRHLAVSIPAYALIFVFVGVSGADHLFQLILRLFIKCPSFGTQSQVMTDSPKKISEVSWEQRQAAFVVRAGSPISGMGPSEPLAVHCRYQCEPQRP